MTHTHLPFNLRHHRGAPAAHRHVPALMRWGRLLHTLRLAPSYGTGSHGNLSVRTDRGCLISATQTFLGTISAAQFCEIVRVDFSTTPPTVHYRGRLRPSTDSLIHWSLYQWHRRVGCVLHAHDQLVLRHAYALRLPQTARAAGAGSPDLLRLLQPLSAHAYYLVRDHGFVATGCTPDDAGRHALAAHRRAANVG